MCHSRVHIAMFCKQRTLCAKAVCSLTLIWMMLIMSYIYKRHIIPRLSHSQCTMHEKALSHNPGQNHTIYFGLSCKVKTLWSFTENNCAVFIPISIISCSESTVVGLGQDRERCWWHKIQPKFKKKKVTQGTRVAFHWSVWWQKSQNRNTKRERSLA